MQLIVEGRAITVLHLMGEAYEATMAKLRKHMEAAQLPLGQLDSDVKLAKDIMEQAGYVPEGKARVESIAGQMALGLGENAADSPPRMARVSCLVCSRMFAVPVGDVTRACPDCGTDHRVKHDEKGELFYRRALTVAPPEIIELIHDKQDADEKGVPMDPDDAAELDAWLKANPDYLVEHSPPGARVADPTVPGSGNPLRFDCRGITQKECDGFDGTDTPGASVCPKCGNKYTVEIINGIVLQRPWKPEDDAPADEPPQGGA